jgi:hypothetical protein
MLSIRGLGSMQLPSSNFGHERSSLSLCWASGLRR